MSLILPPWPAGPACGDPGDAIDFGCMFTGAEFLSVAGFGQAPDSATALSISLWWKRGVLSVAQELVAAHENSGSDGFYLRLNNDDTLTYFNTVSNASFTTTARRRDLSAWSHTLFVWESNHATPSERARLYLDGSRVTDFSSETFPSLGDNGFFGQDDYNTIAGPRQSGISANKFQGSLASVVFLDGIVADPTDFGYFNFHDVWVPRDYSGPYGTNGFHLDFDNAGSLGDDVSGNGNHFTANGMTADNQVADTPTQNAGTLNALDPSIGSGALSEGNNKYTGPSGRAGAGSTIAVRQGKWVYEVSDWTSTHRFGWAKASEALLDWGDIGNDAKSVGILPSTGQSRWDGTIDSSLPVFTEGVDVLRVEFDLDEDRIEFFQNGVSIKSYEAMGLDTSEPWVPVSFDGHSSVSTAGAIDFGAKGFSGTPTSGFQALNAANLPCPTILDPDDYFTTRLKSGGADVDDLSWDPTVHKTLVVSKRLDSATHWRVVDTVQGAGVAWATDDATDGAVVEADGLTAFTATGYEIGANAAWQGNRVDYVWRVSSRAGFDIVGPINHVNGAPSTVAHQAGGAIDYAWVIRTDAGQDRRIFHAALGGDSYLPMNTPQVAATPDAGWFASTIGDLTLGASLATGTYYVYAWRSVPQFSAFTEYQGLSPDLPMILTDFTPRMVWSARSDAGDSHPVADVDRSPTNPAQDRITTNGAGVADTTYDLYDLVGNGAKVRNVNYDTNGGQYLVAAWALTPIKFARAR